MSGKYYYYPYIMSEKTDLVQLMTCLNHIAHLPVYQIYWVPEPMKCSLRYEDVRGGIFVPWELIV